VPVLLAGRLEGLQVEAQGDHLVFGPVTKRPYRPGRPFRSAEQDRGVWVAKGRKGWITSKTWGRPQSR